MFVKHSNGGSVWVMDEWAVGDTRFQKIYDFYSVEHHLSEEMVTLGGLWVGFVGMVGLCG